MGRPPLEYDDEEERISLIKIPMYANARGNIDKMSIKSETDDGFDDDEHLMLRGSIDTMLAKF